MKSKIKRVKDITEDYKLSYGYKELQQLVDSGKRIIGFGVCNLKTYEGISYKQRMLGVIYKISNTYLEEYRFQ